MAFLSTHWATPVGPLPGPQGRLCRQVAGARCSAPRGRPRCPSHTLKESSFSPVAAVVTLEKSLTLT